MIVVDTSALAPEAVEPGAWHVDLSFAYCTEGERALAADLSTLDNVPQCRDVSTLAEILEALGARITRAGERMTTRQLRDEVMTFLLAGHETTAVALTCGGTTSIVASGGRSATTS